MNSESTKIAFPGLGIGEFEVKKIAFRIGELEVAWYGIIITLGIIAAVLYVMYRSTQYKGINIDDIIDFTYFVVAAGIIGARVYFVVMEFDSYNSFFEMINIHNGGLAIYGAIIGGGIASFLVCRYKKIKFWCFFDMIAPAVMLGQIVGRWGNFFNGEAHGGETTNFLRMSLTHVYSKSEVYVGMVHPTFFYESMWNLIGFVLLNIFYKKRKYDGQIFFGYVAWYGFGRMLIEGLRTDSLLIGSVRISQAVGLVTFLAAIGFMIYMHFHGTKSDRASDRILKGEESTDDARKS